GRIGAELSSFRRRYVDMDATQPGLGVPDHTVGRMWNISRAGAAQADGIPDRRTDGNIDTAGVTVGCKRTGYLSR
ncbi:MAG: hypothetical protein KDE01_13240, partial [Caldilineaceae bacterium]|nr:hypothetical protein [Caldilineaceae bacterium]MCB0148603.1 hypothetical protein [Caldilineaceae bacterium]